MALHSLASKLVINYTKNFQVLFKAPNKNVWDENFDLTMGSSILEIKQETKFLGVLIDSNLTFTSHLKHLKQTLNYHLMLLWALAEW